MGSNMTWANRLALVVLGDDPVERIVHVHVVLMVINDTMICIKIRTSTRKKYVLTPPGLLRPVSKENTPSVCP